MEFDKKDGCLIIGPPRSGTTLIAAMIGAHPNVGMLFEDQNHSAHKILSCRVWGNKLCIPNQIQLDPRPDSRSLWRRLEDGVRSVLGKPRWLTSDVYSVDDHLPPFYDPPPHRQVTIRNYVEGRGARVIALLRDPDQVIDSIVNRTQHPPSVGKHLWSRAVEDIYRVNNEYKPLILTFKDLVMDTKRVVEECTNFLEIDFSERVLEGYKYTPQYSFDKIDPTVAKKEVKSYKMEEYSRESLKMYKEMVSQ